MAGGGRKPNNLFPMELPSQAVSFDSNAFSEFLNLHGVRLIHHKALRCPVGMTDTDDNQRPHTDHSGCSNGFIYYKAGVVTAAIQGNSNSQNTHDIGLIESSHVTATFPNYYDGTTDQVVIAPFDRFYMDEQEQDTKIVVPTWHLQTTNQSRIDKLYYPVVSVEKLIDYRGEEYREGHDFCIENGQISWNGGRWPGYQLDVKRGSIYSVRYFYRPYFYCTRLLHEIRVAQVDTMEGRVLARMPVQCQLAREYCYTNEQNDSQAKDSNSLRQTPPPKDGGF